MIRILHNGSESALDARRFASLGEAVEAALRTVDAESRVVTRLAVNGRRISEEDLEQVWSFPLEGVEQVDIVSASVRVVASRSLLHAARYTAPVAEAVDRVSELLRSGQIDDACGLYAEVLDSLSVLVFTLTVAAGQLGAETDALRGVEQELHQWLPELEAAQEQRDWVRLADTLEFELKPLVLEWGERVRAVCSDLPEAPAEEAGR